MHDTFHIVDTPQDWAQHDQNVSNKRAQLAASAKMADARDLEGSAERFRPSKALLTAINSALAARTPLLLTGESGTGKTQVAWYLKRFFQIPLYAYQVHSNSQANDLRYDFDAVAYLRDAYLARQGESTDTASKADPRSDKADPRSDPKYLKLGPLWRAYEEKQCILLIDEIDKAPRDFPNDLLQELDQNRFAHPFHTNEYIDRRSAPPIIVITSNEERRLPDAFLRRCMVHHIALDNSLLRDIMATWSSQFPHLDEATREAALQRFKEIRQIDRLSKKPGTAELLLWLSVLSAQNISAEQLDGKHPLPALICLIKDHADYRYLPEDMLKATD